MVLVYGKLIGISLRNCTYGSRYAQFIDVFIFRGIELKNNEFGKVWTNIQQKKAHADDDTKKMDQDLASKLKERSRKVDEVHTVIYVKNTNDSVESIQSNLYSLWDSSF